MENDYRQASFLLGVARLAQLPADDGAEVAFAGRSNAGKSSVINALTGRASLARIGKTPGRTRELNFFVLDEHRRLVDLPGYGYARVPAEVQRRWALLVEGYLARRRSLRGVVVIMDARRPFMATDVQLLEWCAAAALPVHVLHNKADKLGRGQAARALAAARRRRCSCSRRRAATGSRRSSRAWTSGSSSRRRRPRAERGCRARTKKSPGYCSGGKGISRGKPIPGRGSRVWFPPREVERGASRNSVGETDVARRHCATLCFVRVLKGPKVPPRGPAAGDSYTCPAALVARSCQHPPRASKSPCKFV